MPSLDRPARIRREYDENMARIRREVTRREVTRRELNVKLLSKEYELYSEQKSIKFKRVPHSGWNFASTPTDRENTIENCQNSQLCSIQASHGRKKINENS